MKKQNIGSTFDSWLHEEGLYEDVSAGAIKRTLALSPTQTCGIAKNRTMHGGKTAPRKDRDASQNN
jgi:hypothetical protein